MKEIFLDGRIGKDAEVLSTKNGKKYVRFSVANDTYSNGERKTEWFDVTSFDPYTVESRTKYLTKGRSVIIGGTLSTDFTVKQDGKVWLNQRVNATLIELQSFGGNKDEQGEQNEQRVSVTTNTFGTGTDNSSEQAAETVSVGVSVSETIAASDDDLPF